MENENIEEETRPGKTPLIEWFDRYGGGLNKYLQDINHDIKKLDNDANVVKYKLDFVKLVESILLQLPQHKSTAGQIININFTELPPRELDLTKDDEDGNSTTTTNTSS